MPETEQTPCHLPTEEVTMQDNATPIIGSLADVRSRGLEFLASTPWALGVTYRWQASPTTVLEVEVDRDGAVREAATA